MDKIFLRKMSFYAYHGAMPEEKRLGQRFYVDVELTTDTREAGLRDDLSLTIDYAKVYQEVRQEVENHQYQLIEALAERIAERILNQFSVEEVLVRVTKPDPPIHGVYESVGVEIVRRKT